MDSRLKLEAAKRDSAAARASQTAAAPPAATPPPLVRTASLTATPHSVASSRVQTLEIISQGHCDDGGVLQFGQLLQWMDIAACLSAERHAHLNAVTLVMDDLSVESVAVRVGDIVRLEGVVNAAFSSSMEVGVNVHAESPGAAGERPVCSAGFIFVALAPDGKKVKLAPVVPDTVEERHAYQLACERRGLRQKRAKLEAEAEAALSEIAKARRPAGPTDSGERSGDDAAPALPRMRKACAEEMTELVLPQHANHHGNTFGGQIMAWMAKAATIVARRQAQLSVALLQHGGEKRGVGGRGSGAALRQLFGFGGESEGEEEGGAPQLAAVRVVEVDACHFIAASHVGDRITIGVRVNLCSGSSMEVGVTVYAEDVSGGGPRQINQGFLTLVALDQRERPYQLLAVAAADSEEQALQDAALVRRELRTRRRQMLGVQAGPMPWTEVLSHELCICNLAGLLRVAQSTRLEWNPVARLTKGEPVPRLPGEKPDKAALTPFDAECSINAATWGLADLVSFKMSCRLPVPPQRVFELLSNAGRRSEWDLQFRWGELVRRLDVEGCGEQAGNALLHVVFEPLSVGRGGAVTKPHDYSLLQSWRREGEGCYIIASRSVQLDEVPEREEYERGAILPSGWMVQGGSGGGGSGDSGDGSSELLYVISLNTGKIGAQRKLFPMYALLLLTNLLELHRVLTEAGPECGGDEAPDAAAAEQIERKKSKRDLLEKIRSLTRE